MIPRRTRRKDSDDYLQIYFAYYRKFKYWISFYYLVLLAVILTIPSNFEDWPVIFSYNRIQNDYKIVKAFDTINDLGVIVDDFKVVDLKSLSTIQESIIKSLKYSEYTHPFDYYHNEEGDYFKKRKDILISLSNLLYGYIPNQVKGYMKEDSLLIMNFMSKYKDIRQRKDRSGDALRTEMVKNINAALDSLCQIYLFDSTLKFSDPIQNQFLRLQNQDLNKTFKKFKEETSRRKQGIETLLNTRIGRIPYLDTPVASIYLFILIIIFFLASPFYLQIAHINYKIIEKVGNRRKLIKYKVPTLANMLSNIGLYKNIKYLIMFSSILFVVFIPHLFLLFFFLILLNLSKYFIILVPPYAIFFIFLFKRKKHDMTLFSYHFFHKE